jgi:hypothetical protein
MTLFVVVNKHRVRSNAKIPENRADEREPVFRCSYGKYGPPFYLTKLAWDKPTKLIYNPAQPMPCGASVWMEID